MQVVDPPAHLQTHRRGITEDVEDAHVGELPFLWCFLAGAAARSFDEFLRRHVINLVAFGDPLGEVGMKSAGHAVGVTRVPSFRVVERDATDLVAIVGQERQGEEDEQDECKLLSHAMSKPQSAKARPGRDTTIVNPGFFRTELRTEQSTNYAKPSVADYDERRGPLVEYWKSQNGKQSEDPAKLARAILTIASQEPPPRRFIACADAIATTEQKIADLPAQTEAYRELSTSIACVKSLRARETRRVRKTWLAVLDEVRTATLALTDLKLVGKQGG